jgi:hypothetical protein
VTLADGKVSIRSQPFDIANLDINGINVVGCVDLILVTKNGNKFVGWLDIAQVHVAYFRGQTGTATYDIPTNL